MTETNVPEMRGMNIPVDMIQGSGIGRIEADIHEWRGRGVLAGTCTVG
jgi:hypothetical protein